jgi:DNA primase
MGDYSITMRRSPLINDAERRRRLSAAYSLLLLLEEDKANAKQHESADRHQPMTNAGSTSQLADISHVDLLAVASQDVPLERVAGTSGGEWAGPCPFCGGDDRFRLWPDHPTGRGRWWCRKCERSGDAIDYVRARDGLSFGEALELLDLDESQGVYIDAERAKPQRSSTRADQAIPGDACLPTWHPPAAQAVVEECEAALWNDDVGTRARAWLYEKRGLVEQTIRAWRLGYNPADRKVHGLWVPRGIVIPCFADKVLWYIKVRRPVPAAPAYDRERHGPKYQQVIGGKAALFGVGHLVGKRVVVICEGELDAVLLWQEAGDLVDVVAIGSKGTKPARSFLAHITGAEFWLVALDNDADEAASWWSNYSAKMRRARPLQGNDLTDFYQAGGDLRDWMTYHLEQLEAEAAVSILTTAR